MLSGVLCLSAESKSSSSLISLVTDHQLTADRLWCLARLREPCHRWLVWHHQVQESIGCFLVPSKKEALPVGRSGRNMAIDLTGVGFHRTPRQLPLHRELKHTEASEHRILRSGWNLVRLGVMAGHFVGQLLPMSAETALVGSFCQISKGRFMERFVAFVEQQNFVVLTEAVLFALFMGLAGISTADDHALLLD